MSEFGRQNRAYRAYKMEERKRKLRRVYYHAIDDLGLFLWMMVIVIVTAAGIFCLWHK